jgi:hypothetical protein
LDYLDKAWSERITATKNDHVKQRDLLLQKNKGEMNALLNKQDAEIKKSLGR